MDITSTDQGSATVEGGRSPDRRTEVIFALPAGGQDRWVRKPPPETLQESKYCTRFLSTRRKHLLVMAKGEGKKHRLATVIDENRGSKLGLLE